VDGRTRAAWLPAREPRLQIADCEAETVRRIYSRYLELGSVGLLADELARAGIRTKVRPYANGRSVGGVSFSKGSLAQLLQNPLFIGKVRHRGELYDGEHNAIVDAHAWNEVQQLLATNRRERLHGERVRSPSLLTGLITDADGRPMTPVFTTKGTRQHRYYVTRLKAGKDRRSAWRVPAGDIDRAVLECTSKFLTRRAAEELEVDDPAFPTDLARLSVPEQRKVLLDAGVTVQLGSSAIIVSIDSEPQQQIPLRAQYARRGNEMKLVVPAEGPAREPDQVLLKLLAHASAARESITTGTPDPMVSNYSKRHSWQLLRLNWLAPDIVTAMVEGRQPVTLTGRRLLRAADVPLSWEEQRRYFGFS
jgi:site-specific DNA recombinase